MAFEIGWRKDFAKTLPMDFYTLSQLEQRLSRIEIQLAGALDSKTPYDSITNRLNELQLQFESVQSQYPAIKHLNHLVEKLNMKIDLDRQGSDRMSEQDDEEKGIDLEYAETTKDTATRTLRDKLSIDYKSQVASLQHKELQHAATLLKELAMVNSETIINPFKEMPIRQSCDTFTLVHLNRHLLLKVAKNYDVIVLKSMIVIEQYVDLVSRENTYWMEIMDQIRLISNKVRRLEERRMQDTRY